MIAGPSEIGILADSTLNNNGSAYQVIDSADLKIKPYRDGYLLQFNINGNSEIYIRSDFEGDDDLFELDEFTATGITPNTAQIDWTTLKEPNTVGFIVEVSEDGIAYDSINYVDALGTNTTGDSYSIFDLETSKNSDN